MKNLCRIVVQLALVITGCLVSYADEVKTDNPGRGHGRRLQRDCQQDGQCTPRPFGDYCPSRHADFYGARQPLTTELEARQRLAQFFKLQPDQIIIRKELRMGYIAAVISADGKQVDRVFIDKRNGRIRSIR